MQVSIANRRARIIERPDKVWIASGLARNEADRLSRRGNDELAATLCREVGDATILRLDRADGKFHSLTAWKGLTSCHEVFFRVGADAETVVTDHFRNALTHLRPSERVPSEAALCDHFLFRTVPAQGTLCPSIRRLGRGERLEVNLANGRVRHRLFDHVEPRPQPATTDTYLARIDQALDQVLAPWREVPDTANLFSGGVDSTLIHTYLGDRVPAVSYDLPHYADDFEAGYADRAARLLGLQLQRRPADLDGYLASLEQLIAATGMPPPHLQLALYQDLFAGPHQHFLIGDQADAVFGIGLRNLKLAGPFRSVAGRLLLGAAVSLARGRPGRRLRRLRALATALAQPRESIDGYAGRFGVYADLTLMERLFGHDRVRARLGARLERVLERTRPSAPPDNPVIGHLEAAQMIDFLAEDIMMCFRHLALAHGKTVMSPFMTGVLFDAALTIPAEDRYVRGLQGKYLPKLLLSRRLPDYPIDQPKGYSHLSLADLSRHAMGALWERYDVPELFNGELGRAPPTGATPTTWNAMTLAIWQQQVCDPSDLQPVPGTRRIEADVGPGDR